MLLQLEIQNIALIDSVEMEPGDGLNILTGETGAGKSIIIDSINAILGDRISRELIRSGKEKAMVQAVFRIPENDIRSLLESYGIGAEDETLIVAREFTAAGKNLCRINGRMCTVSMLKALGEFLIDVHGQHDNQSLLRTGNHIIMLDSYAGKKISELKKQYLKELDTYRTLAARLKKMSGDKRERERRIDLLRFQIDEIGKARLKTTEEEELSRQRLILANSERIIEALSGAYQQLVDGGRGDSASDALGGAVGHIHGIVKISESYQELFRRLQDIAYQLDDIAEEVRKERDSIDYSPDMLEEVEERLDVIFRLKKKYGGTIAEILQYYDEIQNELDGILKNEETQEELTGLLETSCKRLRHLAGELRTGRESAAKELENRIEQQLNDLEMKNSRFKVNIQFDENAAENAYPSFHTHGLDQIEFLISPNAGEQLKPLAKIASGGEMSRIMLAIKTILADVDAVPTLIFDEIDIGISGKAAQKVGEKLSLISKTHQVLCVTHLAQIACMADCHYLIEKKSRVNSTETKVLQLQQHEISGEIARILGGSDISEITLRHAEEMLENAKNRKG